MWPNYNRSVRNLSSGNGRGTGEHRFDLMRSVSLVLFVLGLLAVPNAYAQRTTLDGVYSDAQAARGAQAYGEHCAMCHEGADVDGPSLKGDPFIDDWREDTLDTLFTFIKTRMPRDAQGSLPENMYLDILAHLLKYNDYRAGSADLTAAAARNILVVGRDGPKPLPNNVLVQVTGCFTPAANNAAQLTKATSPSRTRAGDEASAEELKSAEAKPSGSLTFRLRNLDTLTGFNADAAKGHVVMAKGVLGTDSSGVRINATLIKPLAASCMP